jgi:hypothetical protein
MNQASLRAHLGRALSWGDAHVTMEAAVDGFPTELRGTRPAGLPYSAWELLEHMRLTQRDILHFCRDPDYRAPAWPEAYWPEPDPTPSDGVWQATLDGYHADREELIALAGDPAVELGSRVPAGDGQSYLREILLVIDHTAYHLGQLVLLRRLLGTWPSA